MASTLAASPHLRPTNEQRLCADALLVKPEPLSHSYSG